MVKQQPRPHMQPPILTPTLTLHTTTKVSPDKTQIGAEIGDVRPGLILTLAVTLTFTLTRTLTPGLPDNIKPGLIVVAVDGELVMNMPTRTVWQKFQTDKRPLTVQFIREAGAPNPNLNANPNPNSNGRIRTRHSIQPLRASPMRESTSSSLGIRLLISIYTCLYHELKSLCKP